MALGGGGSGGGSRGIRAGSAYVELGVKDRLTAALNGIKAKFATLGKGLAIGAGAGIAGAGGLFAAAIPTLKDISQLDATRRAFGLTAEEATGLFGVMKAAGSDVRDATEGLVTLGQRVSDAVAGKGEQAAALFEVLGVSASEFADLNPAEQFYKMHAALRQVQDPAKQVQLLLQAVGEDTGKNLISTLSMSTEELKKQAGGFELSTESLANATKANQAYGAASAKIGRIWQQLVTAAAPGIEWLAKKVEEFTGNISDFADSQAFMTAHAGVMWAKLKAQGRAFTVEFGEVLVDGWQSSIFVLQNLWLDLTTWMKKAFVDMMAAVVQNFRSEVDSMVNVLGKLPGGQAIALGVGGVAGAVGNDPEAVKKKIDEEAVKQAAELNKERQREVDLLATARRLAEAKSAEEVAAAQAALDALRAARDAAKVVEPTLDRMGNLSSKLTNAVGFFGNQGGLLQSSLGSRSLSPQVAEQKKTNSILEQIHTTIANSRGFVFG